jgi:succinate dehydrogenase/fumarate reductase flavoprotein subunit
MEGGVIMMADSGDAFHKNSQAKPISQVTQDEIETDVLVIGGGMAGIFAAIKAKEKGLDVTMTVKGAIGSSGMTPFANTFMVFAETRGHQREEWIEKFRKSGEYMVNLDYLDMFLDDSKARWEDLVSWGAIGVNEFGPVLRKQVLKSGVRTLERVMITDLLKQNGQIVGAIGFPLEEDKMIVIRAKATIMCAGPGGFKPNGYPISSVTHDGDAMAYRVGVEIGGKEFVDFHFTNAEHPADSWFNWHTHHNGINRSETPLSGKMPVIDNPRQVHEGMIPIVFLLPPWLKEPPTGGFPNASLIGKEIIGNAGAGLGIHKSEGIWPVNEKCASKIPGLYAAGDGLCSMLCGAVYTGLGTSLSGSACQGARAGQAAAGYASSAKKPVIVVDELGRLKESTFEPRSRQKGFTPTWVTQQLQNIMIPYYVLLLKKQGRLEAALENIEFLRDHLVPKLIARDPHELRLVHETKNMLLNAEMKLRAGLFRTETRGSHIREDHPARKDPEWLAWVLCKEEDGKMKCVKEPIPVKWRPDLSLPMDQRYWYTLPGEV